MTTNYPVPYHPTWEIHDTSKIKEYLDCPRKYFWRYVLGWNSTAPNNHLIFGEAFHRAMAYMLQTDYSIDNVMAAYNEHFLPYYREHLPRSTDELFGAKTPDSCLVALAEYSSKYSNDFNDFKVHHVEVAGAAPISDTRVIHLRIDCIAEDSQGLFALEHKTGSGISRFWTDQWDLDLQPATYTHALRCHAPDKTVRGCKINGVHFKKLKAGPKIDFVRLPIWKTNEQMGNWLFTIDSVMDEIEWNFEQLSHARDTDPILSCFRQNPGNCTKYFGCAYHDMCGAWGNPLGRCEVLQSGFDISFWDPRELEAQYQLEDVKI